MKKQWILITILAGILCIATFAAPAAAGPKLVRVHSQMPVGHFNTKAMNLFVEEASRLTGGELNFVHYPAQQLYSDKEMPDVLPKGGVEIAQINGSMFIGKVPETGIGTLPATFEDLDHFYRYYMTTGAREVMDKAYQEKANVFILSSLLYSPNNAVLTTQPIKEIADYKGKKIRGWGKTLTVILEAWDASGVVMSSGDVYMALERGTIDGAMSGLTSFWARKWYEAAKYVNVVEGLLPAPFTLAANLDFWNGLTKDQKTAILKAAHKAEVFCTKAALEGWNKAEQGLKSKGVEVFYWPGDKARKLKNMAQPGCLEILVKRPLGEEMLDKVTGWVEEARASEMSWEQATEVYLQSRLELVE